MSAEEVGVDTLVCSLESILSLVGMDNYDAPDSTPGRALNGRKGGKGYVGLMVFERKRGW